jgi:hypothetical protein
MVLLQKETTMPKLNDTQLMLLSTASQREDGSLLPLPTSTCSAAQLTKAKDTLRKAGLIVERETTQASTAYRSEDELRYGLFITPAGLAAIGITDAEPPAALEALPAPTHASKAQQVLHLLAREGGASTADLIAATGWLPHTMRAALTGLRKKGHVITSARRDNQTCYRLEVAA